MNTELKPTSDRPIWRIVWAPDQTEKRLMHYTDSGIELLQPEIREVRKYSQFKDCYVLERLEYIQGDGTDEMTVSKVSYEPKWTFVDRNLNPLQPRYEVAKIIIDAVHAAIYQDGSFAKYKDTDSVEERDAEIGKNSSRIIR
jgi:hypothetical protein